MEHYFYGGDKDGQIAGHECTDALRVILPQKIRINTALADYESPLHFEEELWYHEILRLSDASFVHVYIQPGLKPRMKKVLFS